MAETNSSAAANANSESAQSSQLDANEAPRPPQQSQISNWSISNDACASTAHLAFQAVPPFAPGTHQELLLRQQQRTTNATDGVPTLSASTQKHQQSTQLAQNFVAISDPMAWRESTLLAAHVAERLAADRIHSQQQQQFPATAPPSTASTSVSLKSHVSANILFQRQMQQAQTSTLQHPFLRNDMSLQQQRKQLLSLYQIQAQLQQEEAELSLTLQHQHHHRQQQLQQQDGQFNQGNEIFQQQLFNPPIGSHDGAFEAKNYPHPAQSQPQMQLEQSLNPRRGYRYDQQIAPIETKISSHLRHEQVAALSMLFDHHQQQDQAKLKQQQEEKAPSSEWFFTVHPTASRLQAPSRKVAGAPALKSESCQVASARVAPTVSTSSSPSYLPDDIRPKRPLSAYNIFFKHERARMLGEDSGARVLREDTRVTDDKQAFPTYTDATGVCVAGTEITDATGSTVTVSSKQAKTPRKAPHRKVGFQEMARVISKKWNSASPETKAEYQALAAQEKERYKQEKAFFLQKQCEGLEKSRKQLEATVDEETRKRYIESGGTVATASSRKKKRKTSK